MASIFGVKTWKDPSAEQLEQLEHARRFDQDSEWLRSAAESVEQWGVGRVGGSAAPARPCLRLKTEHGSKLRQRFRQPFVHRTPLEAPSISVAVGGSLLGVKIPSRSEQLARGIRSAIGDFTWASGRNLSRKMNALNQGEIKIERVGFGTLTYPHFFVSPREGKKELKAFLRKLQAEHGRIPLFWKLEPQKRGAPHFHLMIFATSPAQLQALAEWVPLAWFKIAGRGDRRHLRFHQGKAGNGNEHCLQPIRTWDGAKSYCAKYLAKSSPAMRRNVEAWEHPGRWWGTRFYDELPRRVIRRDLTEAKAKLAKRLARRWYEHQDSGKFRIESERINGTKNVQRLWLTRKGLAAVREVGAFKITAIKRRWKFSRGGMTIYAPHQLGEQILRWLGLAFDVHDDPPPPESLGAK